MRFIFRLVLLALFLCIGATLHYTLPKRDIVVITGTEITRQDFSNFNRFFYAQADSGSAELSNRDLRLINTQNADGTVMVYRNEDTGLGWPYYLKFDSADLQAEAQASVSSLSEPQWFAIRHYGWRSNWLTTYRNALSIKPVAGPDVTLIPWFNIVFLTVLLAFVWGITVRIIRFRRNRIDPLIEAAADNVDDARDSTNRWFRRLFGSKS